METRQQIRHYCKQFHMNGIQSELNELIIYAENRNSGYLKFTVKLLQAEVTHRERNFATESITLSL